MGLNSDKWLERLRFNGMLLASVSYGIFLLLTIQASIALYRQHAKITTTNKILLAYVAITFVLATLGFAGNASYTQTVWVEDRNEPGGPPLLLELELDHWINQMALACYYVMEWFMEALLLHRCFIIWNQHIIVVCTMTTLFLATIAMSVLVLVDSRGAIFYNIDVQLAYLCIAVGMNILYTILVGGRILVVRNQVRKFVGKEHAAFLTSAFAMVIESAAMYSVLGVLYIASFAAHSNLSNLIFLDISHVQGIAQLLIILRVAEGRAYTREITSQLPRMEFSSRHTTTGFESEPSNETSTVMGTISTLGPRKTRSNLQIRDKDEESQDEGASST
ncbi:hypothetical protein PUNSTDRAFT_42056 [Punctularia strigosozonata HHB-11173 SS5]|uniref:uncharacterized protein n=1 Tax=Punctularia strigosozonata (strain HHB-11173) TaxID=741275 RepID=UPI0004416F93|nr:uncharacterized protein PUNSTDRAFT_42056 [Punctularia strigosozonata HHB-11173 SS5]EIN12440.1 hypothetical protein PUNSTDRAFT_42056 [Punctularia strigosozonata HHB-11173 SS5]